MTASYFFKDSMRFFRLGLLASCALGIPAAYAQTPSNEELYKLVLNLKAEQDKLREENRRVKIEADEARAQLSQLRGEQRATKAKVDAVARTTPTTSVGKNTKSGFFLEAENDPCSAYGNGYRAVSNSGTCVRLGGYARAEAQYTPQQKVYRLGEWFGKAGYIDVVQGGNVQDTVGTEVRGRVDLDAITKTAYGDARVSVKLRVSSLTGTRAAVIENNGPYAYAPGIVLRTIPEAAFMQLAGFTVGIAPSNYALMPTFMYTGTPWAQYTNGVAQVSYKHDFGSGLSATGAVERAKDWAYNMSWNRLSTAFNIVGNMKWEQAWGWLALQGVFNGNSVEKPGADLQPASVQPLDPGVAALYGGDSSGQKRYNGGAVGITANFKIPQLHSRDQIWFTANYANGNLGALLAAGGLSNISTQNNGTLLGGILRVDQNMMVVSGMSSETNPYRVKNVQGFNIAAMMTHYWSDQWRSNFNVGYVQINPPRSVAYENSTFTPNDSPIPMWGKGQLYSFAGSLIYSIAENFDVGIEAAYAYINNKIQNAPSELYLIDVGPKMVTTPIASIPGLQQGNAIMKIRMERLF